MSKESGGSYLSFRNKSKKAFNIFEEDIYEKIYQETINDNANALDKLYLESKNITERLSKYDGKQLMLIKAHADSFIAGVDITTKILIPLMGFVITMLLLLLNSILSISHYGLFGMLFAIWLVLLLWFNKALAKFKNRVLCARFIREIVDLMIEEKMA